MSQLKRALALSYFHRADLREAGDLGGLLPYARLIDKDIRRHQSRNEGLERETRQSIFERYIPNSFYSILSVAKYGLFGS
jgi:hypothetical protein